MGAFFSDWALWAKMCFVLGIAIGLTAIAGVCKLGYDQWLLKKHTEREKHETKPMLDEEAQIRRGRAAPFGVRAIESGIEVEGVWISRGNTPTSSAPGSPMIDAKGKATSRSNEIPSLQIPEPSHPYSQNRGRSPNGSTGSFERATSAERLSSASSPELVPVPRGGYQPRQPSALRYSTADDLNAQAGVSSTVQDFAWPLTANQAQYPSRSASGSSQESYEGESHGLRQSQHIKEPQYYRPTGSGSAVSSPQTMRNPETMPYAQPSRSDRSSYAAQGYTYGIPDSQAMPPRQFHYPSSSQGSINTPQDPFATPPQISNSRGYMDAKISNTPPQLESIELMDHPVMGDISPEKAKRTTRKLQKKAPGS